MGLLDVKIKGDGAEGIKISDETRKRVMKFLNSHAS